VEPETRAAQAPKGGEAKHGSAFARSMRFVARHPTGVIQGVFIALLAIVVLQNLEPTSIDLLFWSVPSLPKLVLILVAMLAGGVLWEIARRVISR